jgi:hypothetical protein
MRFVLATLFMLHGIAHVVGFLGAWAPTRARLLGDRIDLGMFGLKLLGLGWFTLANVFAIIGVAAILDLPWWTTAGWTAAGVSIVMCLLQLPETKFGIAMNVVVLGALAAMRWL